MSEHFSHATGKMAEANNVKLFSVECLMQILVINAEGGRYYEALIDILSKYVFESVDGSALQRGNCADHRFHTKYIHTSTNSTYIESFNCHTELLFTTNTTICRLAISPHTHNRMWLRVAQVSVFKWLLVIPKGQGHAYVGAVATKFLMTAFITS